MFYNIVTNMGREKKPWEDVPIEVLIELERQKQEKCDQERHRLYAPMPQPLEKKRTRSKMKPSLDFSEISRKNQSILSRHTIDRFQCD